MQVLKKFLEEKRWRPSETCNKMIKVSNDSYENFECAYLGLKHRKIPFQLVELELCK